MLRVRTVYELVGHEQCFLLQEVVAEYSGGKQSARLHATSANLEKAADETST